MNKYILVATPGMTDPIRGESDGPILHIARHYKPQKVVLFLSEEVGELEKKYHHNRKAIQLLSEKIGERIEVQEEYMGIKNPHSYDDLFPLMEKCKEIKERYPEYQILLNITSGTPQAETAFCMISLSDGVRYLPVQVNTPERASNKSKHFKPGEDLIEEWFEVNLDNEKDAPNRCVVPKLLNYKRPMVQFQISSLISNYDYSGALQLYIENQDYFSEKSGVLLRHAQKRLNLEDKKARNYARDINSEQLLYPIARGDIMIIVDFYNSMKIKQNRGELNDFAMRLEILTVHLGIYILEKCAHISLDSITYGKDIKKLSREKSIAVLPGIDAYLDQEFQQMNCGKFNWGGFVNGRSIVYILKYLCKEESFQNYRDSVEEMLKWNILSANVRNPAAHTITAIEEADIKKFYEGKDSLALCKSIQTVLIRIFSTELKKESFEIYQMINDEIQKSLEEM